MNAIGLIDDLIKEYLLWRGFTFTMNQFDNEKLRDKTKGFKVSKTVDMLLGYADNADLTSLLDTWNYLDERFFQFIRETDIVPTVKALGLSLKRYYVVSCFKAGRRSAVSDFFVRCGAELRLDHEWQAWFALPFIENPSTMPEFKIYFSKAWSDNLVVSLHNFLCSVFQALPLPKLLSFHAEKLNKQKLESQVEFLQSDVQRLTSELQMKSKKLSTLQSRLETTPYYQSSPSTSFVEGSADLTELVSITNRQHSNSTPLRFGHQREKFIEENASSVASSPSANESRSTFLNIIRQQQFTGHTASITSVRLASDLARCASAALDGTVRIWSVSGGSSRQNVRLKASCDALSLVWQSISSKLLFVGTSDGHITVWDSDNEKIAHTLATSVDCDIVRLCLSEKHSSLAALCGFPTRRPNSSVIKIFDFECGMLKEIVDTGQESAPHAIAYNKTGSLFATGSTTGVISIRASGARRPITQFSAHDNQSILGFCFDSRDRLVSIGQNGSLSVWEQRGNRSWHSICEQPYAGFWKRRTTDVAVNDNGLVAIGGKEGSIQVFDLREIDSGAVRFQAKTQHVGKHQASVVSVDWLGDTMVSGSIDNTAIVSEINLNS